MNLKQYRAKEQSQLENSGVHVEFESYIKPNSGSETAEHFAAKALSAYVMEQSGWIVNSEVEIDYGPSNETNKEADLVCWGNMGRSSWVVEIERKQRQKVLDGKLDIYVKQTSVADMEVLDPGKMPSDLIDALGWITQQLPASL